MANFLRCSKREPHSLCEDSEKDSISPFPFLCDVNPKRVKAIHHILLCDISPSSKDDAIEAVLEHEQVFKDKFNSWKYEVLKTMNDKSDEAIFGTAKQKLESWFSQGERLADKRKVDMDAIEANCKTGRTENDLANEKDEPLHEPEATERFSRSTGLPKKTERSDAAPKAMPNRPAYVPKDNGISKNRSSSIGRLSSSHYSRPDKLTNSSNNAYTHSSRSSAQDTTLRSPASAPQPPPGAGRSLSSEYRQKFPNWQPKIKATNILLLGETGVGKTTFINSLANYLSYATLDEALHGKPVVLVDVSFTYTDKKNRMVTIEARANAGTDYKYMKNNERLGEAGISSTQDPVDHIFKWVNNGEEKLVRIIDTPGINDTRGVEKDAKNFESVLRHISELGELHAICILMKPNESKLTVGFRYCIDELLLKLHKNATKNILFCFTNTRSACYRPGDTLSTLHEYLKLLEQKSGVYIKADRTNMFCFDNDCFRYLCMLRQLPNMATKSNMDTFSDGWHHNIGESNKMLETVHGMTAHSVEDTVSINETRKLVTALARPLAEMAKIHVVNIQLVKKKVDEIERLKAAGRTMHDKVCQEQVVLEMVPLAQPRTVCTSPQCNNYVKVNEYQSQPVPKKICHENCVVKIQELCINNPGLAGCQAFSGNGVCYVCRCHWSKHMHISYHFRYARENVVDRDMQERVEKCRDQKNHAEILLKEHKDRLKQMENEHDTIRESCAEFAAFLATNSIKQTADPYADYLSYMINDECNKTEYGGDNEFMINSLCDMEKYYKKKLSSITGDIKAGIRQALSSSQLNAQIDNLCRLKFCGPMMTMLKNTHLQPIDIPAESDDLPMDTMSQSTNHHNSYDNENRRNVLDASPGISEDMENLRVNRSSSSFSRPRGPTHV